MKVLEHSESRLVIKDGLSGYKVSPLHNLFGDEWNGTINIVSGLGSIALATAWTMGRIPKDLMLAAKFLFFILVAPLVLAFAAEEYKGTPNYIFDKSFGQLTVHHNQSSKSYALADIVDVVAVSTAGYDPPPTYWRKIHLVLRSGEELELHPGHDRPDKQTEMVVLIRQFLDLP